MMSASEWTFILHASLISGEPDVHHLENCLQNGADPNDLVDGVSAMHIAAGWNEKVVGILLKYGGDPNVLSDDHTTPLHVAASWGHLDTLQLLLQNGADITITDLEGKTALDLAHAEKHETCCAVLKYHSMLVTLEDTVVSPKYIVGRKSWFERKTDDSLLDSPNACSNSGAPECLDDSFISPNYLSKVYCSKITQRLYNQLQQGDMPCLDVTSPDTPQLRTKQTCIPFQDITRHQQDILFQNHDLDHTNSHIPINLRLNSHRYFNGVSDSFERSSPVCADSSYNSNDLGCAHSPSSLRKDMPSPTVDNKFNTSVRDCMVGLKESTCTSIKSPKHVTFQLCSAHQDLPHSMHTLNSAGMHKCRMCSPRSFDDGSGMFLYSDSSHQSYAYCNEPSKFCSPNPSSANYHSCNRLPLQGLQHSNHHKSVSKANNRTPSPDVCYKRHLSPFTSQERYLSPSRLQEKFKTPTKPQEKQQCPSAHQERYFSPSGPQERYISLLKPQPFSVRSKQKYASISPVCSDYASPSHRISDKSIEPHPQLPSPSRLYERHLSPTYSIRNLSTSRSHESRFSTSETLGISDSKYFSPKKLNVSSSKITDQYKADINQNDNKIGACNEEHGSPDPSVQFSCTSNKEDRLSYSNKYFPSLVTSEDSALQENNVKSALYMSSDFLFEALGDSGDKMLLLKRMKNDKEDQHCDDIGVRNVLGKSVVSSEVNFEPKTISEPLGNRFLKKEEREKDIGQLKGNAENKSLDVSEDEMIPSVNISISDQQSETGYQTPNLLKHEEMQPSKHFLSLSQNTLISDTQPYYFSQIKKSSEGEATLLSHSKKSSGLSLPRSNSQEKAAMYVLSLSEFSSDDTVKSEETAKASSKKSQDDGSLFGSKSDVDIDVGENMKDSHTMNELSKPDLSENKSKAKGNVKNTEPVQTSFSSADSFATCEDGGDDKTLTTVQNDVKSQLNNLSVCSSSSSEIISFKSPRTENKQDEIISDWKPPLPSFHDHEDLMTSDESFVQQSRSPRIYKMKQKAKPFYSSKDAVSSPKDGQAEKSVGRNNVRQEIAMKLEKVKEVEEDVDSKRMSDGSSSLFSTISEKKAPYKNSKRGEKVKEVKEAVDAAKRLSLMSDGSSSLFSTISVRETLYKDPERGITLIEKHVPSDCGGSVGRRSIDSVNSAATIESQSTIIYDWRTMHLVAKSKVAGKSEKAEKPSIPMISSTPRSSYCPADNAFGDCEVSSINRDITVSDTQGSTSDTQDTSSSGTADLQCDDTVVVPSHLESLSNEELSQRLVKYGEMPGPVVAATRQTYLRRLASLESNPGLVCISKECPDYPPELRKALNGQFDSTGLAELEMKMVEAFDNSIGRQWREGSVKSSFTYLLLDPRITDNLPLRAKDLSPLETFKTFICSIFYIGKGKRARPYCHLYEAVYKKDKAKTNGHQTSDKVKHILDIWSSGLGVVSLHCFQSVIPVEAYTREACMLEAIGLHKVTNLKRGDYYGLASTWPMYQRRKMGVYLLQKALQIFLAEGERQICVPDLKHSQ